MAVIAVIQQKGGVGKSTITANVAGELARKGRTVKILDLDPQQNLSKRHLHRVGVKLELPWLGWHVFRHTHATFGEQIGMALSDRQAQMGHSDVRMTLHYTDSDLNRRRQSIEELTARLIGSVNCAEIQPVLTLFDTKPVVM